MLRTLKPSLYCATLLTGLAAPAFASAPLIHGVVDDRATITLTGEHAAAMGTARDLGEVASGTVLPHVNLVLKRSPEMQAAFDKLVADQQIRGSADYHRWLKPAQLRQYGPAQADIDSVAAWLRSHNLTVHGVSPSGMTIDFGGTVADIAGAFHTSLHQVSAAGEAHIGNTTDIAIPAALAPVVRGATLSNFFPKPQFARHTPNFTIPTSSGNLYGVVPADFATIYNLNPLFNGNNLYGTPITGAGVTLAMVEQTDILPSDWTTFRRAFGLSGYNGTLTLTHPNGCADPGTTGDEGEAALDTEWSTSTAPDASIIEASCAATSTLTFGVEVTLQALVEGGTPATVFSISYGGSEAGNGFTFLTGWSNLIEEAAAQGIAVFVSTGDSGASAEINTIDTAGIGVNGLASNIYDTAVGGTDFLDTALGTNTTYWNPKNNSAKGSAKSYVPETTWNNSCASPVLAKYIGATSLQQSCNSNPYNGQPNVGAGGGQSIYYAKPSWQANGVLGMPKDGVRDLPDVSLFAANGLWNHFYLFCMSDPNQGGTPCTYNNVNVGNGNTAGGTSFAAPAMAGIMGLIQQAYILTGGSPLLGNAAPRLYAIAQAQYANPLTLRQCNATLGNKISTACVFQDVKSGNISGPCVKGSPNCFTDKQSTAGVGVLAVKTPTGSIPAFPTTSGYDLATGLGSLNVTNLVYQY